MVIKNYEKNAYSAIYHLEFEVHIVIYSELVHKCMIPMKHACMLHHLKFYHSN